MIVLSSLMPLGIWPLLAMILAVTSVTLMALLRAKREDIPGVFASFARGFGLHRSANRSPCGALEGRADTDGGSGGHPGGSNPHQEES
ncbi:hypothetical protein ACFQZZ_31820 [Nocardia sp. GCM10030253]|uniref:hypothetical protein n=1 Tax=Nocardia sp. GCM10030253 TaxID=3273404 RepID=UPI00363AB96D